MGRIIKECISALLVACMLLEFTPLAIADQEMVIEAFDIEAENNEISFELEPPYNNDAEEADEITLEESYPSSVIGQEDIVGIEQDGDLEEVQAKGTEVAINEANFPDVDFRNYVQKSFDTDGNGSLSEEEIGKITQISDPGSANTSSLKGIEFFTSLKYLACTYRRNLTSLDVSKNTKLTELNCAYNQLSTLDVSKNTALIRLSCNDNVLSTLDVSNNTALEWLYCGSNNLAALDVSKNTSLIRLGCSYNNLTSLDVSKNTNLERFYCEHNQLKSIDISYNTSLKELCCYENSLTELDLSNNKALMGLSCDRNKITTLDLKNNTALTSLSCGSNQLTVLDVSNNPNLWELWCEGNQLSTLNLSRKTSLQYLYCSNNNLNTVDISNCPKLIQCYQKGEIIKYTNEIRYNIRDNEGRIDLSYELGVDKTVTIIDGSSPTTPSSEPDSTVDSTPTTSTDDSTSTAGKIELSANTNRTIYVGDTLQIVPVGQTAKSYKSSSAKVASVTQTGLIKGLKAGKTNISVALTNKKTLKLALTVEDPSTPTSIAINDPGIEYLPTKGTVQLTISMKAKKEPAKAKLTWKSSTSGVASVDKNGKVTGKKAGTATITVTTDNKLSASFEIMVLDDHTPTSITIEPLANDSIGIKDKVTLKAVMTAKGEPVSKLTWKSLNSKVASVDSKGVVTGKSAGTATITVTTANKLTASIDVTVSDIHAPTSLSIEPSNPEPISVGEKINLNAVMTAIGEPVSKLTWKSSNPKVLTVDNKGVVTSKGVGTATITVTTQNKLSSSVQITVESKGLVAANTDLENAFLQSSAEENWLIRYHSINLSRVIYTMESNSKDIEAELSKLGFGNFAPIYYDSVTFNFKNKDHKIAFIMGYNDIDNMDGKKTRVFAVICRGTHESVEWLSDFTIGSGTRHYGFDNAASDVYKAFADYWWSNQGGEEVSDYKVWITGHSRGAAVANLVAGYYLPNMGFSDSQIYGYTFACPFVEQGPLTKRNNIFNYNLGGDLIARVPFQLWNYQRYGRDYILDNGDKVAGIKVIRKKSMDNFANYLGSFSNAEMNSLFEEITNEIFDRKGEVSLSVIASMLIDSVLKNVPEYLSNPVGTLKKMFILSGNLGEIALRIGTTHPSQTYMAWIDSVGTKKLI